MKIKTLVSVCCLALALLPATSVYAESKAINTLKIEYEVYKNDIPFATVKEKFSVQKQGYQLSSLSKGIGVFALLGKRQLNSHGKVTAQGLAPSSFKQQQGEKVRQAKFDWPKQVLTMQAKGKTRTAKLEKGTQDIVSFAYQFRFNPPVDKQPYHMTLTTGKRVKNYTYQVEASTIELDGKPIETLHLYQDKPGKESKEFWIAKAYEYLPIYIVLVDKRGQRLEQTVTKFSAN